MGQQQQEKQAEEMPHGPLMTRRVQHCGDLAGGCLTTQIPQDGELTVEDIVRHRRWSPWQRHPWGRVIQISRHHMNVKVRHDVAQEHVVDVTGRKGPADRATDMLNIPPVNRQFLRGKSPRSATCRPRKTTAACPLAIARRSSRASLVRPL